MSSFSTRPSRTCRNARRAVGPRRDIASRSIVRPARLDDVPARAGVASTCRTRMHELLQVKRLRQVLVGADLEAFEPVLR